jgi:anti-sigma factor RsiW
MPILANDLESLETYLDGALSDGEAEALRQRLSTDADLSAALKELRLQRATRQAVWASLEPDPATAERFNWRIRGAIADQERACESNPWRFGRIGSVAAACIVFGFFAGWMGRGNPAAGPNATVPPSGSGETPVAIDQRTTSTPTVNPSGTPILVPVTNEYGQVVAWQQFPNAGVAKDFTEDLHRANHVPSAAPSDDRVKLLSDEKF